MLNVITDVNYMQSIFSQCKFEQSKVTNETITEIHNIETDKINKKQSKMNPTQLICCTLIKVLNVNTIVLILISLSAFSTKRFVYQFIQHFPNRTILIFLAYFNIMSF